MLAHLIQSLEPGLPIYVFLLALPVAIFLRYLFYAGGALAITSLLKRRLRPRRLQPFPFTRHQLFREAAYSALTACIFAVVGVAAFVLNNQFGVFRFYKDIDAYGWIWFVASIPAGLLIHDFYFYWMHRLIHLPGIYKRVHAVHHLSTNPSPLSAFAFHPLEAVLEAFGYLIVLVLIPVHPIAFAIFSTFTITYNVIGHLGYEIYPSWLIRTPLKQIANTPTSHNQHHRTFNYNFGLYTLIWDHFFGTLHPRYSETFAAATRPALQTAPSTANTKEST